MPLAAPLLLVLLGATPPSEDVPALLRSKTERLLDAITRGDPTVWEQELDAQARVVDEQGEVLDRKASSVGPTAGGTRSETSSPSSTARRMG